MTRKFEEVSREEIWSWEGTVDLKYVFKIHGVCLARVSSDLAAFTCGAEGGFDGFHESLDFCMELWTLYWFPSSLHMGWSTGTETPGGSFHFALDSHCFERRFSYSPRSCAWI